MMRVLTIFFLSLCLVLPLNAAAADFDPGSHRESLGLLKKSQHQDPSSKEKKAKLVEYYLVMGREKIKRGKYEEAIVLHGQSSCISQRIPQTFCLKPLILLHRASLLVIVELFL